MAKYLDKEGLETYEVTVKGRLQNKQDTLVSGSNIKTINGTSLLGSGDISVGGGGTPTDVKINGTSITAGGEADILTESAYNSSTNKIATMSDVPDTSNFIDKDVNNLTNYSLTTTLQTDKSLTKGVEYIVGTQGSDTNAWKGTSTDTGCSSGTLYTGKMIMYHLPTAGTSSAATLNLTLPDGTTTGAKNIYRQASTTVTTTFAAGCDIFMVYDGTQWKINAYVDTTNSNTIGYQLRTNSAIWTNKTGYTIKRYVLLFEVDGGLSGAATSVKTETTKTTVAFKYIPGGVIKYYSTNESVTNNSNFATTGLWDQYAVNLGYTFNTGSTLESGKPVYMRCSVNSDGTLSPNYSGTPSHPIVQALPSTADGKVYVYLGQAYSTTNMELCMKHPIYEYKNGKIREYVPTIAYSEISGTPTIPTNVSDLNNDAGYITSYTETDPVYSASAAAGITSSDISNWNGKMDFTEITTTSTRIWDMSVGAYKTTATTDIYYDGSSNTSNKQRVREGSIIFVADSGTNKSFIVISPETSTSNYTGYTSSSAGFCYKLLDKSDIVNNLTTSTAGSVLDASQGKALKDLIDGLATVASSGDYTDLINKPTIPSVGNSKIYYGTCDTTAGTQEKAVTCSGFTLETGAIITVYFSKKQSYNGAPTLNVNSTGAKTIKATTAQNGWEGMWAAGEAVTFVYDGTNYIATGKAPGSTANYGIVKLYAGVDSTATNLAATASSVKTAYDLANGKVTDVQANGTSILSSGVANLVTNTAYDSTTNPLATVSDLPSIPVTDVQIESTSILSSGVANIQTSSGGYNSVSNKIVTESTLKYETGIGLDANKTWTSAGTFKKGQIVWYGSKLYRNITGTNTANSPNIDTTNWENVTFMDLSAPDVLYYDTSGSKTDITLSDSVSNYSYLEIFYGWETNSFGTSSTRYDMTMNGNINLSTTVLNNSYIYFGSSEWTPTGNKINLAKGEYWRGRVATQSAFTRTESNNISIYKVLGYK